MNRLIKTFVVVLFVTIVTSIISCSTFRELDFSKVKIGMNKAEVAAALRKKTGNVVAAKHLTDPESITEVILYCGSPSCFYLYFVNDKLEKWRVIDPNEKWPVL